MQVGEERGRQPARGRRRSKEIEGFRGQLLETRRELRDVQHALRSDIESLRDGLRFLNIAAVPILVAVIGDRASRLVRRIRFRRRFDRPRLRRKAGPCPQELR